MEIAFLWFLFYALCGKEEEEAAVMLDPTFFDKCEQIKNDVIINRLNFSVRRTLGESSCG